MQAQQVVVTTKHRGVFFGTLRTEPGRTVTLAEAQMGVYWSKSTHGVVGLAAQGPLEGSRVSPPCPELEIYDVTAIFKCTPEAVKRWRAQPWT